jgi:hypothetical protein
MTNFVGVELSKVCAIDRKSENTLKLIGLFAGSFAGRFPEALRLSRNG